MQPLTSYQHAYDYEGDRLDKKAEQRASWKEEITADYEALYELAVQNLAKREKSVLVSTLAHAMVSAWGEPNSAEWRYENSPTEFSNDAECQVAAWIEKEITARIIMSEREQQGEV